MLKSYTKLLKRNYKSCKKYYLTKHVKYSKNCWKAVKVLEIFNFNWIVLSFRKLYKSIVIILIIILRNLKSYLGSLSSFQLLLMLPITWIVNITILGNCLKNLADRFHRFHRWSYTFEVHFLVIVLHLFLIKKNQIELLLYWG